METPLQAIERLLTALEELVTEEQTLVGIGSHADALKVQEREQPLVQKIVELLFQPGVSAKLSSTLQIRAQSLLNAQQRTIETLGDRIAVVRKELGHMESVRVQARRIRPAYGRIRNLNTAASFAGEA